MDAFAPAFQDVKNEHMKYFFVIIPPLVRIINNKTISIFTYINAKKITTF